MSAYLIVEITVRDPERYAEYRRLVPPLIARHGGEFVVRGGTVEVHEGDWTPERLVVIRFPDRDAIRAFMRDPDYLPLIKLRHETCDSNLVAVDGV